MSKHNANRRSSGGLFDLVPFQNVSFFEPALTDHKLDMRSPPNAVDLLAYHEWTYGFFRLVRQVLHQYPGHDILAYELVNQYEITVCTKAHFILGFTNEKIIWALEHNVNCGVRLGWINLAVDPSIQRLQDQVRSTMARVGSQSGSTTVKIERETIGV